MQNNRSHPKHNCNRDFFADATTQLQAYWLGFIAADGCVTDDGKLNLVLGKQDEKHVQRFIKAIGSDHSTFETTVRLRTGVYTTVGVSISSVQMVEDLARYGIRPRKSFGLEWPQLPERLERHFIRGFIDGDGSFGVRHEAARPSLFYTLSVTGYEPFIRVLQTRLMNACGLRETVLTYRNPGKSTATMNYRGRRQITRIVSYLYAGATVYLPRKYATIKHLRV